MQLKALDNCCCYAICFFFGKGLEGQKPLQKFIEKGNSQTIQRNEEQKKKGKKEKKREKNTEAKKKRETDREKQTGRRKLQGGIKIQANYPKLKA
jgi:hypothetical protein